MKDDLNIYENISVLNIHCPSCKQVSHQIEEYINFINKYFKFIKVAH